MKLSKHGKSSLDFDDKFSSSDLKSSFLSSFFLFLLTFMLTLFGLFFLPGLGDVHINKVEIKKQIVTAIENKCDLRVIKNIFENHNKHKVELFKIVKNRDNYYNNSVSLLKVLEDIRSDIFTIDSDKRKILSDLDTLIIEHSIRNPFDVLEMSQKDYFENIRFKSGDKYNDIRSEVDKIAKELETKNSLVTKYLNQATTSFWVSIIALFISLISSLYQIFLNRSSRQKLLLSSILSEFLKNKSEPKE